MLGDFYIVHNVLADWSDERAVSILENCCKAKNADALVLIIEMLIPPKNQPFFGKPLDLQMMGSRGGAIRTEEKIRGLVEQANLKLLRVIPTGCRGMSILECK